MTPQNEVKHFKACRQHISDYNQVCQASRPQSVRRGDRSRIWLWHSSHCALFMTRMTRTLGLVLASLDRWFMVEPLLVRVNTSLGILGFKKMKATKIYRKLGAHLSKLCLAVLLLANLSLSVSAFSGDFGEGFQFIDASGHTSTRSSADESTSPPSNKHNCKQYVNCGVLTCTIFLMGAGTDVLNPLAFSEVGAETHSVHMYERSLALPKRPPRKIV